MAATTEQWYEENRDYLNWWISEYPFLGQFELPIKHEILINYYYEDMENRNFEPMASFANNYDFVFSYFLDNYTKPEDLKFKGKTALAEIINSIPKAISETAEDIKKPINISLDFLEGINKNLPLILLVTAGIVALKLFK